MNNYARLKSKIYCQMLIQLFLLAMASPSAPPMTPSGCPEKCGSVTIPFPFGTRKGCYLNESYFINCRDSHRPFLGRHGISEVLSVTMDGRLRILAPMAYACYRNGMIVSGFNQQHKFSSFRVSNTGNMFTAVGCDTVAFIQSSNTQRYMTGCISLCTAYEDATNGSCSGIGCCQTSIPKGIMNFSVSISSITGYKETSHNGNFSNCSYAFLVEENRYNFSIADLGRMQEVAHSPMVLDWSVGDRKCKQAQENTSSYLCKENTMCYDADNGPGYLCICSLGYSGNPYLPNGCQDINECDDPVLNDCLQHCTNTLGNYTCSCPKGQNGDGRKGRQGCISGQDHQSLRTTAIIGISMGFFLLLANVLIYLRIKEMKIMKRRQKFFLQNGGPVLQKLLHKSQGSAQMTKLFTEEELKNATKNFSESHVVSQGGHGKVYKGTLENSIIVAIKTCGMIGKSQIQQFINEVIILSQMNHPHVVKLLGCCLETPIPLLVYEFITNKTLFHHLHEQGHEYSIPWKMRLKIATETAKALAYMHSTAQIIHRDVKSANILLDDEFTVKVADFGISRFVPLDKTHLSTLVQGTFGYIDPEYFRSGILTEKTDVYSFGVVLVELLTRKRVFCLDRPENDRGIAAYFVSSMNGNSLFQVLDDQMKREGNNTEQLKRVADLAKRCLELKGEIRPTMKQVKAELETLAHMAKSKA